MSQPKTPSQRMHVRDALSVLVHNRRDDHIVITNQGSARIWPQLASCDLDFHYNPSTMGGDLPFEWCKLAQRRDRAAHDLGLLAVALKGHD